MRAGAAALLACLLLAACQTVPVPPAAPDAQQQAAWEARLRRLTVIDRFDLKGRIASTSLGGGSADIAWKQDADHLQISLSGALGVGALRIEGTPDDLVIFTRDGRYQSAQAEQALVEKLGAPLPISDLRFWVIGIPRPGPSGVIGLDAEGRLGHLEQDGWQLDYLEYRPSSDPSLSLPRKLWLSCGSNRWKVVIDQWVATE